MRRYPEHRMGGALVGSLFLIGLLLFILAVGFWNERARSKARTTKFLKEGIHEWVDESPDSPYVRPEKIPRGFFEAREVDNSFEVQATFPDNDAREVMVTVDQDRNLKFSVSNETRERRWSTTPVLPGLYGGPPVS